MQTSLAKKAVREGLNVRKLQRLIDLKTKNKEENKEVKKSDLSFLTPLIESLQKKFRTSIKINYKKGKGKIEMEFYSNEQLTQLIEELKK